MNIIVIFVYQNVLIVKIIFAQIAFLLNALNVIIIIFVLNVVKNAKFVKKIFVLIASKILIFHNVTYVKKNFVQTVIKIVMNIIKKFV